MSDMLTAFLAQSNIDDQKADLDEAARNRLAEINYEKGVAHLSKTNPSMLETINGPTKLDPEDLKQNTEINNQFKKYDHSLESIREWNIKRH